MTTAEKGMTFDLDGNPIIYKKPKVGKEMMENLDYSVPDTITTFTAPVRASRKDRNKATMSKIDIESSMSYKQDRDTKTANDSNASHIERSSALTDF
jgi:hypothetical protein